jgi:hypothetical protein
LGPQAGHCSSDNRLSFRSRSSVPPSLRTPRAWCMKTCLTAAAIPCLLRTSTSEPTGPSVPLPPSLRPCLSRAQRSADLLTHPAQLAHCLCAGHSRRHSSMLLVCTGASSRRASLPARIPQGGPGHAAIREKLSFVLWQHPSPPKTKEPLLCWVDSQALGINSLAK